MNIQTGSRSGDGDSKHRGRDVAQKNEENLRRLWDISKRAHIQIIGMPEGEEEEQEIENLFRELP